MAAKKKPEAATMTLSIPIASYKELTLLTRSSKSEIQGFFQVEQVSKREFRMGKLFMLKARATSSSTDSDFDFLEEPTDEESILLRGWWHTHPKFNTGFSSTDYTNVDENLDFPYVIMLCTSATNSPSALLYVAEYGIYLDMKVELDLAITEEEMDSAAERVRKCIIGSGSYSTRRNQSYSGKGYFSLDLEDSAAGRGKVSKSWDSGNNSQGSTRTSSKKSTSRSRSTKKKKKELIKRLKLQETKATVQ
jgi:proteasome lid subunit RPN8/RPN11|tara:strand:- start:10089 stop:10835 length:747 start_codon:yes stop_codon:yes gene_type:complete